MNDSTEKVSGFATGLKLLLALPDNTQLTAQGMRKGHVREMSKSAAYNILWKLNNFGAVRKCQDEGRGVYRVVRAELLNYVAQHDTRGRNASIVRDAPPAKAGKRGPHKKRKSATLQPTGSGGKANTLESTVTGSQRQADMDIIDNLLNAMAEAEPVLKRYKEMDSTLREFFGQ